VAQAPADNPPAELMTREKANGLCWMELEESKKAPKALEARSKMVATCTEAKMRSAL
jgi:hypothetical protein